MNASRPICELSAEDLRLAAEEARARAKAHGLGAYADLLDAQTGPAAAPGLVMRRASEIPRQEIRWLWRDRIPAGKLTMIVGDPGLGKSSLTCDIAARATTGATWPDSAASGAPGSVLILSAEDDAADTIVPRLLAAGADTSRVYVVDAVCEVSYADDGPEHLSEHTFNLGGDLGHLEAAILRLEDVRLIIVDPISAYLGAGADGNGNVEIRALLAPLAALAARTGVAVVAVSHLNKGQGAAIYRTAGSIAFVAAARAVWAVVRDPEDGSGERRLFLPVKMNLAADTGGLSFTIPRAETARVAWGEAVHTTAADALAAQDPEEHSERADASSWLLAYLEDGPRPARDVFRAARSAGHADRTLKRVKRTLGVRSDKRRDAWFWSLPGHGGQGCQESPPEPLGPLGTLEAIAGDGPGETEAV